MNIDEVTQTKIRYLKAKADYLKMKAEKTSDEIKKSLLLAKSNLTFLQIEQIEGRYNSLP